MNAPSSQPLEPVRIETTRDLLEALRQGRSLVGANLEGAYLSRGLFDRIRMPKANLTRANLRSLSMQQADLRLCNFRRTEMERANFAASDLRGSSFSQALGTIATSPLPSWTKVAFRRAISATPSFARPAWWLPT